MKLEILVICITLFFIMNIYNNGKYLNFLKSFKKYYQIAGIAFAGLSAYLFLKKNPSQTKSLISSASGIIKHLPIDKESGRLFDSILDMTQEKQYGSMNINNIINKQYNPIKNKGEQRILQSGNKSKRSVSETKKKYVAAQQGWKCGSCGNQLSAWFEVDHKQSLEHGGTNNIENLIALCRECHGKKTSFERF